MTLRIVDYATLTPDDLKLPKFWGLSDEEMLRHEDLDSAIEEYLEESFQAGLIEDMTLDFDGFVPMQMSERGDEEWVLAFLLERWDNDYGDPETSTTMTEKMRQAAVEFVETVRSEYRVYACEPVIRVRVPVVEWVKQRVPEWLLEVKSVENEEE